MSSTAKSSGGMPESGAGASASNNLVSSNSKQPRPTTLSDYRAQEGQQAREARLRAIWRHLPRVSSAALDYSHLAPPITEHSALTRERAEKLKAMYLAELLSRWKSPQTGDINEVKWSDFLAYANAKEAELWSIFHDELDLDGNGHLDHHELESALSHAGITLTPTTLSDFMSFLASTPDRGLSFTEFRDFLLLLPRKASTQEIYRYYQVRKVIGDDERGASRTNMEGDVSVNAELQPPHHKHKPKPAASHPPEPSEPSEKSVEHPSDQPKHGAAPTNHDRHQHIHGRKHDEDEDDYIDDEDEEDDEEQVAWLGGSAALKFLLAGGVAGGVSRTATAPFDRLKVFLMTRPTELLEPMKNAAEASLAHPTPTQVLVVGQRGVKTLFGAVARIYAEGGVLAFWVGNGLNTVKIFPESAIKFLSYESSKRFLAKYWDKVEDSRDISGTSRFVSGGIGGLVSQLSIYPIETVKTQMMSAAVKNDTALMPVMRRLWTTGGVRAYYRGLGIGLVGVFPYSAIDMSTFEALKLAYARSIGDHEPGVLALLAFGSVSGSVGATSVYPLNLVRTRLQASGSSGHPQRYTGIWDVAAKTYEKEGWKGFYKGLIPTLAKVVPAVSISYVVYERTKQHLGV